MFILFFKIYLLFDNKLKCEKFCLAEKAQTHTVASNPKPVTTNAKPHSPYIGLLLSARNILR
jgi:hypothetical protein